MSISLLDRSSPLGSQVSAACALVRQSRVLRSSVVITRLNLRGDCVSGRALQCSARSIGACPQNRRNGARDCLVVRIGSLTNPLFLMGRSPFTGARSFFSLERGRSTARHDAPIDYHAPSAGSFLDGDQPEAFCEPDDGTGLSPADVGTFGDLCGTPAHLSPLQLLAKYSGIALTDH
jgi:hypothetical protein